MERADRIGLDPGRLLQRLPGCTVMGNFQPIAPDCRDFQHRRRQLLIHAEHVGQRVPRYVDAAPRAEPAGIPRQIPAGRHGVDIRIAAAGTEHRTLDRANGRKIHIVEGNRRIDFHVEPGSSACRDRAAVQPPNVLTSSGDQLTLSLETHRETVPCSSVRRTVISAFDASAAAGSL